MASALRSLRFLRLIKTKNQPLFSKQLVRHGSDAPYTYRQFVANTSKASYLYADFLGFTLWYWMLYKLYHEFDHIVGHFTYPDPSKWTNEELGIPADDEELEGEE